MRIILAALFLTLQFNNAYSNDSEYLVTSDSAGPVRFGMNAQEIQKMLGQNYKLQDEERAEVNSIALYKGKEQMFEMFFASKYRDPKNFDDCQYELKEMLNKPSCIVDYIEIYNEKFSTKEGVHAGMNVAEAEKIYGKAKLSGPSEIEAEEDADFQNAPKNLSTKINYCQASKTPMTKCKINALLISH